MRLRWLPAENDAPLIVNANAIKAPPITPQGFEAMTGWGTQIIKRMSCIEGYPIFAVPLPQYAVENA
jgi:hypothetical protein